MLLLSRQKAIPDNDATTFDDVTHRVEAKMVNQVMVGRFGENDQIGALAHLDAADLIGSTNCCGGIEGGSRYGLCDSETHTKSGEGEDHGH